MIEQPAPPGTNDVPSRGSNEYNSVSPLAALPSSRTAGFASFVCEKFLSTALPPPPPPPPLDTKPIEKPSTRKRPHGMVNDVCLSVMHSKNSLFKTFFYSNGPARRFTRWARKTNAAVELCAVLGQFEFNYYGQHSLRIQNAREKGECMANRLVCSHWGTVAKAFTTARRAHRTGCNALWSLWLGIDIHTTCETTLSREEASAVRKILDLAWCL